MKVGDTVSKNGIMYIVISMTKYLNDTYIFVMNKYDDTDVKFYKCMNELIEVTDIDIIKEIVKDM